MQTATDVSAKLEAEIDAAPSIAKRVEELISTWHLPARRGTSAESNSAIASFNESKSELVRRCEASRLQLKSAARRSCASGEIQPGELFAAGLDAKVDAALLVEASAQLAKGQIEIADQVLVELRDAPVDLEKTAEAVVAKVRVQLGKIGNGVESQPAFPYGNLDVAERQLDILARNNVNSRAALAAVADAREEHADASRVASVARQNLEDAKRLLVAVARRALAG